MAPLQFCFPCSTPICAKFSGQAIWIVDADMIMTEHFEPLSDNVMVDTELTRRSDGYVKIT